MAIVDTKARLAQTTQQLRKKIAERFKQTKAPAREVEVFENSDHSVTIQVANGLGLFSEDMADIVRKHEYAILLSAKEFPGCYDWRASTYIEDCSAVTFRI